ncbi:hypothetical protein V8G54_032631 [Vigna mungo]|uniref:Uncharacterized protein n=1 Tax=Vigna mungo TaxID=3915 RepID=A0AAQ3RFH2_VIGMU
MGSMHRTLIETLPESESTNAMFEMATRTTSMAWYLWEFADCRGAETGRLKVATTKQKEVERGLHEKNQALTDELAQANEKISKLNASVIVEHEEGFDKALR